MDYTTFKASNGWLQAFKKWYGAKLLIKALSRLVEKAQRKKEKEETRLEKERKKKEREKQQHKRIEGKKVRPQRAKCMSKKATQERETRKQRAFSQGGKDDSRICQNATVECGKFRGE